MCAHFLRAARRGAHSLRRGSLFPQIYRVVALVRRLHNRGIMDTKTPRKVLVATDFSEGSDEAIDRAIEIAKPSTAEVEIMHVIQLGEELPFGTIHFDADYAAFYGNIDRQLSQRADRFRQAGLTCETKIVDGTAPTEIVARARAIGADLIVLGTHGRTGLAHAMLGSVAERVVRRASCPVLTVPYSRKAAA
jgi:nucleotide-binding universal stress UspA family protein